MKIGSIFLKVMLAFVVMAEINSCTKQGGATVTDSNVDYYTCTMHPSVHSNDPGKCPICSMDLVPVMKKEGGEATPQAQAQGMKGGEKKAASGEMQGMPGMPGMKEGEMKGVEKPSEFVV